SIGVKFWAAALSADFPIATSALASMVGDAITVATAKAAPIINSLRIAILLSSPRAMIGTIWFRGKAIVTPVDSLSTGVWAFRTARATRANLSISVDFL